MTELYVTVLWLRAVLARSLAQAGADERGEISEKAVIVAIFVALAITVGGVIAVKVTQKANGISFN